IGTQSWFTTYQRHNKEAMFFESLSNYFSPFFSAQIIVVILPIQPPITMRAMQVAHIDDVYRPVHRRFCIKKFDASILCKYTNIEGHFAKKISQPTTID